MSKAQEWQWAGRQDRAEECVRQAKVLKFIHGDDLVIVPDSKIRGFLAFTVDDEWEIKEHLGAVGPELKDKREVNMTGQLMTEQGLRVRMDVEV